MTTPFESGAREEIRWAETTEAAVTATAMTRMPHGGNPTGPSKNWSMGPTDEVTSDLTVTDNARRGFTTALSFQNVIRYGVHDLIFEQMLNSRWLTAFDSTVLTNISRVAAGNKFVAAAGTPFAALSAHLPAVIWIAHSVAPAIVGQPVLALSTGAAGAELNIATASAGGLTLTDVAAGGNFQAKHSGVLKNGTTLIYALIERAQTGLAHFHGIFGAVGTQWDFNGQKNQDPTWSFQFMGRDADTATATYGTSVVQPPSWLSYGFGSELFAVREGGAIVADLYPQAFTRSLRSNGIPVDPGGIDGPHAHMKSRFQISGQATWFSNNQAKAIGAKAKSKTDSSLQWGFKKLCSDGKLRAYVEFIPLVQYESDNQEGGGEGGVLVTPTPWQSAKSPTHGFQWSMSRFDDVPASL